MPQSIPDTTGLGITELRLRQVSSQLVESSPVYSSAIVRSGLELHAQVFERLHNSISRREIPALPIEFNASAIFQRIYAGCASPEIASRIHHSLVSYTHSRSTRIKALRSSTVYWFNNDKTSWPVVEWVEGDDTNNLAIFHFGDPNEPPQVGCLMHSGLKVTDEASKEQYWRNSRIDWNVAQLSHLKTLFGVAQHILGMLEWSVADATSLYRERKTGHQSVVSASNVETGAGHDSLLGVQPAILMNENRKSISHASNTSFTETGPTQEIIDETRDEFEDILASYFPLIDRTRIERIANDVMLSLESSYPHPGASAEARRAR